MNHSKIVPLFQLKIYVLILITCYGCSFSAPVDSSHSVVQVRTDLKYPFQVPFRRIQTYRSFSLFASGTAKFSSDSTIAVTYSKPIKNSVTYYDTVTITADKKNGYYKNSGYKNAPECDPFHILMMYCYSRLQNIVCKGSFDSIQVYAGSTGKRKYLLSLDRTTRLWRELSFVNSNGTVYERTRFYYKNESMPPSSVVVETVTGGKIVKDSLVIGNGKAGR
jgi:hypothetical protein